MQTEPLRLTAAVVPYDRTLPLLDGRVTAEGLDVTWLRGSPVDVFWRMLRYQEFDASELSLSTYLLLRAQADPPYVAVPAFPLRMFRHGYIFVHNASGIERPEDLRGKRVGLPEYQQTAVLWIRGLLEHEYGVVPRDVRWYQGGMEQPGREEKIPLRLPPDVIVEPLPPGETLSGMLERGDLDAVMGATVPSPVRRGSPHVRLLFPDYEAQEAAYYRRTGIFPIMHVFALRSDVYRAHPWAARSLYVALRTARDRALQNLTRPAGAPRTLLPWAAAAAAEQGAALQTPDPWTYGVAANRATLEAAVQYSYEQGLSARRLAVEELFAPETLED